MQEDTKRRSKVRFNERCQLLNLFSAMPRLEAVEVLVSIMMSVNLSNKGKPLKLRHYDISRAHFQGTAQRLNYIKLPGDDRQKCGEDKVGRLIKSIYGTRDASHIWQLAYVNLICGFFRRLPKRQTQCSIVPQSKSRCENGSAWRRLCVFVCR